MDEAKQQTVFDSDQQQIGEIYANALIGFGQKNGNTESLLEQFSGVVDALNGIPKLKAMLQSPGIGAAEKLRLLEKALSGKVDGKLLNFLKVVLSKGRFDCINAINSSAKRLFDELSGRVHATLTTADAVDDTVRQQIEEKLAKSLGKKIQLVSKVDANIIGGMVIRIGDTVYDGSVQNHLKQVRNKATKRAADAIRSSLDRFMST